MLAQDRKGNANAKLATATTARSLRVKSDSRRKRNANVPRTAKASNSAAPIPERSLKRSADSCDNEPPVGLRQQIATISPATKASRTSRSRGTYPSAMSRARSATAALAPSPLARPGLSARRGLPGLVSDGGDGRPEKRRHARQAEISLRRGADDVYIAAITRVSLADAQEEREGNQQISHGSHPFLLRRTAHRAANQMPHVKGSTRICGWRKWFFGATAAPRRRRRGLPARSACI